MNITFDKKLKQRVWQAVNGKAKNNKCPFCDSIITAKNFAGGAFIQNEFRVFDGNILCLLEFSDAARKGIGIESFIS